MSDSADIRQHFDQAHAARDDPWGVTTRWYEVRKREILLASLPRPRFAHALEVGCSIGVLTEALAARADRVTAIDISAEAVRHASVRLALTPTATVLHGDAVDDFPEAAYDLVVVSEAAYYLGADRLDTLAGRIAGALTPDGVVVACHWRHPESDFRQSADEVNRTLASRPEWSTLVHHVEDDFVLDVLARDGRSVAQQTGLV
ncbi:hypothetical protein AX769_16035 [Frondihabitans sp. PAMC 28766]|uniref:class I SAM-dependent DNA methyltransferase n=1 Tax=Frondihabitans sp. PAMC 28766 TaxID=1795630 RepID=UPI00078CA9D7|nr:class I SAM-dependent methyltransferase [Frondihabitans sp. PAMC 28766]AMM21364.1 hypothetical protein AX769_16035 [Frondihabitans sp. PAMC 28766]